LKKLLNQFRAGDVGILLLLGLMTVVIHALTNTQYGFHRDELATLDDARHLDWGYVAYPPVTPFIARLALTIFGPSLVGLRLFSSLAIAGAAVFTGLMVRELGGSRRAQVIAAIATSIAPVSLISGSLFQYFAFDYLGWVLLAYLMIRLLNSEDPRWWLGIGIVIGLGMMTKYTMGLFVAGIAAGVILTTSRHNLKSPWLWAGAALSLVLFLPNLIWQAQHHFISLDFLKTIHARDVRIGRTTHNFLEQFFICANVFTIGIWTRGLWSYLFNDDARRYRVLGWMYVVPLAVLLVTRGRSYYLAPAYPMLFAAGTVAWERRLTQLPVNQARLRVTVRWASLGIGALAFAAVMLPIAPVNSGWWKITNKLHDNFREEIGWPELVQTVAGIYQSLPAEEKARTGILAGNYGEAGAIDLYGPAHGLPQAISGINSYWLRGYGNPPPETIIALGRSKEGLNQIFATCSLAGHITNRYGVENEETRDHPDIFVCRSPRESWDTLWQKLRSFG
jgi:hypothetical protein